LKEPNAMEQNKPLNPADGAPRGAWMTAEQAAAFLGLPVVTLRRALERNARTTPEFKFRTSAA
jgi:hypothetical protein